MQEKTLYCGGDIITMDQPGTAVLTEGGRILSVGEEKVLRSQAGSGLREIRLEGRTMMPAFLDSHSHLVSVAATLSLAPLGEAGSFEEILEALKTLAAKNTGREWVIGFGYDHSVLSERRHPDRQILDAAFPDRPVLISHASGHMGVANSQALARMGITRETADPDGGRIGRDADGELNGYLEETAFTRYAQAAGAVDPKRMESDFFRAQQQYLGYGISTAQEGFAGRQELALLEGFARKGGLLLDVRAYCAPDTGRPVRKEEIGRLKIGGYKIFLDGSPQGKTAWLTRPYEGEDDYRGYPVHTDAEVDEAVRRACGEGVQLLAHCNGDAAADQLIAAFERENQRQPVAPLRPVMIHAQMLRSDQLDRMKPLGMIPSFFPAHLWHWGDVHRKNLGERAFRISPLRDAQERQIPFTLHQDSPVLPNNLLEAVWCAVNRISRQGVSMGEAQRITPLRALQAITIDAAYQYFEEGEKGSITPGKRADFVLLDRNPLTVPPQEIRRISVTETILQGESVYRQ
ncbi:MAG: amidohydrolase [Oscillospiraceae bacterium]|nr:MAG: amidohydrolase [Oscillospiraceae bacterium]